MLKKFKQRNRRSDPEAQRGDEGVHYDFPPQPLFTDPFIHRC
jgi:hypothetical protein